MRSNWKSTYRTVLIATLIVSFIFRVGNPGWLLIIFGLLYCGAFILHGAVWGAVIWKKTAVSPFINFCFYSSNLLFLLANVFNIDLNDINFHMFFMQYQGPPEAIVVIVYIIQILWLLITLISLITLAIQRLSTSS